MLAAAAWSLLGCASQLQPLDDEEGSGACVPTAVQEAFDRQCATAGCHDAATKSASLAASFALAAFFAPASTSAATDAGARSKTFSSCPAFTRFFAMGPPILPSPINPIAAI